MRKHIGLILGAALLAVAGFLIGWAVALPQVSAGLFAVAGAAVGALAGATGTFATVRSQERIDREQRGFAFRRERLQDLEKMFLEFAHLTDAHTIVLLRIKRGRQLPGPDEIKSLDAIPIIAKLFIQCPPRILPVFKEMIEGMASLANLGDDLPEDEKLKSEDIDAAATALYKTASNMREAVNAYFAEQIAELQAGGPREG